MSEQITTAAELDALPVGSIVARICSDGQGNVAYALTSEGWRMSTERIIAPRVGEYDLVGNHIGPLVVLYRPDAPARTEPTEEQVATEIERFLKAHTVAPKYPWEGAGIGVSPLELARAVLALLPQRVAPSEEEIARTISAHQTTPPNSDALAQAVAALYASAPTVSEVKAEAWDQAITAAADALDDGHAIYELPNPYRQEVNHA